MSRFVPKLDYRQMRDRALDAEKELRELKAENERLTKLGKDYIGATLNDLDGLELRSKIMRAAESKWGVDIVSIGDKIEEEAEEDGYWLDVFVFVDKKDLK